MQRPLSIDTSALPNHLGDDSRLLALEELAQLADLQRDLDEALETLLRVLVELLRALVGRHIALDVHPDRRALASCAAETEDNTGTVIKADDLALVLAD